MQCRSRVLVDKASTGVLQTDWRRRIYTRTSCVNTVTFRSSSVAIRNTDKHRGPQPSSSSYLSTCHFEFGQQPHRSTGSTAQILHCSSGQLGNLSCVFCPGAAPHLESITRQETITRVFLREVFPEAMTNAKHTFSRSFSVRWNFTPKNKATFTHSSVNSLHLLLVNLNLSRDNLSLREYFSGRSGKIVFFFLHAGELEVCFCNSYMCFSVRECLIAYCSVGLRNGAVMLRRIR